MNNLFIYRKKKHIVSGWRNCVINMNCIWFHENIVPCFPQLKFGWYGPSDNLVSKMNYLLTQYKVVARQTSTNKKRKFSLFQLMRNCLTFIIWNKFWKKKIVLSNKWTNMWPHFYTTSELGIMLVRREIIFIVHYLRFFSSNKYSKIK